jgi:hypothetical protein
MSHTSQHPEPPLWPAQHRLSDIPIPSKDRSGTRLTWEGPGWYGCLPKDGTRDRLVCFGTNKNAKPADEGYGSYWFESKMDAIHARVCFGGPFEGGYSVRNKRNYYRRKCNSKSKRSQSKRRHSRSRKNRRGKK